MSLSVGDPQPAVQLNALMEILGSSESVAGRIEAFKKAKAEAEEALANLRVGMDAKAAYEDANAKAAQASDVLEKSNRDADEALRTLAAAQDNARKIVAEAQAQADRILANVRAAQAQLDELRARSEDELRTKSAAVDAALAETQALAKAHADAVAEANAAKEAAVQAENAARLAQEARDQEAGKLKAALANMMPE